MLSCIVIDSKKKLFSQIELNVVINHFKVNTNKNTIMEFDSSSTESAKEPIVADTPATEIIQTSAFENRMNEMVKANVGFGTAITNNNVVDSTIITSTEASSQKSPPKINNA